MWLALPVLSVSTAVACGPFFPHSLLGSGKGGMVTGPYADLGRELLRIEVDVPAGVVGSAMKRDEAELRDARRELGEGHPALPAIQQFRTDLRALRWADGPVPPVPEGLPPAWHLYLDGVRLRAMGRYEESTRRMEAVFAMPSDEAGSRGLWAGSTLAMTRLDPEAVAEVRARVLAGEPDTLGVTGAGVGWLALREWYAGRPVSAIHGYLAQHHTGDPSAEASLQWAFRKVLSDPDILQAVAKDPQAATALTLWMVSGGGTAQQRSDWLDVASVDAVSPPSLLAWVAWLNRDLVRMAAVMDAAEASPMTRWLGARKAMLEGDLDGALSLLEEADFRDPDPWTCAWFSRGDGDGPTVILPAREVASERGVLLLRAGEDVAALRAFAAAGYWFDTAHVAERVVSLDALKAQVAGDLLSLLPEDQREPMKALLGRRIFRSGDPLGAAEHLPPELGDKARRYAELTDRGTASALWEAARLLRVDGMELSGTELAPDFAWSEGMFPAPTLRRRAPLEEPHGLTPAESDRIEASAPSPNVRFHYRYRAAELAWQAAEGIPKGHPEAPKVLCQAGRWLEKDDPDAADRFYKEMVWRGWGTPLGQTADALRWFPAAELCALDAVTVPDPPWWQVGDWLEAAWEGLTGR